MYLNCNVGNYVDDNIGAVRGFAANAFTNDALVFQSGLGAPPPSLSDRLTSTVEKGIGAGIALAAVAVVGYLIFNYHTTKKLL